MDCINDHLKEGRPIIVGVNHTLGKGYNDGTIDHFVLIVGSGYDEISDKNYYIYVETGTNRSDVGITLRETAFTTMMKKKCL